MPTPISLDPARLLRTALQTGRRAPCSSAQERYWRMDRDDPGTPSLNIAVKWRIRGHLDAGLAQEAFQATLVRHETLRSSIAVFDGQPMQLIADHVPFKLSEIDLSGLAEPAREAEAGRIAALDARTRFDLAAPPLLRATLLRLGRSEAILLVTAHHIVSDGWSMGIIARDFVSAYRELALGGRAQLPELPLQYADFVAWNREALAGGMLAREELYWKDKLADLSHVAVPPDVSAARPGSEGATIARLLPRPLTSRLADFARGEGMTFFVAAYAVLLVLLQRRTGASDIVVSTQMAGRDEVELEGLVGPFVNTVVLRTQTAGRQSFTELCDAARETFEEAIEHCAWPFDRIDPRASPGSRPVVSVNFIVQRAFIGELASEGFRLSGIPSPLPAALYDLNFILVEREEGWRLTCEYRTWLYEEETVRALVAQFEEIAEAVLRDPGEVLPLQPPAKPAKLPRAVGLGGCPASRPVDPASIRRIWFQKTGTQPPLFALNHTAHNQNLYRPLSRELGEDQPFLTLQIMEQPGGSQPASIEELAAHYCQAILATRADGRYRLVGFCRTGVITCEVARQLTAAGHEVDLLVLVDCWGPGYFLQQPYWARTLFRLRRAGRFARRFWRAGPRAFATRMSFWLQSTASFRRAKRLLFWRPAEDAADEAEFWRATDALEEMVQHFELPDYAGRTLIFRSEAIPAGWPPDPMLGWATHLPAASQHAVPGEGHEGAFSQNGARAMARHMTEVLYGKTGAIAARD